MILFEQICVWLLGSDVFYVDLVTCGDKKMKRMYGVVWDNNLDIVYELIVRMGRD